MFADPKGTLLGSALIAVRTREQDAEWFSKDPRKQIANPHPTPREAENLVKLPTRLVHLQG
jgi:hypothetical protein